MKRMKDATSALLGGLAAAFPDHRLTVEDVRSRSWASATFAGARHEVCMRVDGEGAAEATDRFLANLSDAEFDLRGHIVADIALVSDERRDGEDAVTLTIEALTVEED